MSLSTTVPYMQPQSRLSSVKDNVAVLPTGKSLPVPLRQPKLDTHPTMLVEQVTPIAWEYYTVV